jgi:hypothetical protein
MTFVEDLERKLVSMLLDGLRNELAVLRAQYDVATVTDRAFNDRGFTTLFSVPPDVRRVTPASFRLRDVGFRLHNDIPGMTLLSIDKGALVGLIVTTRDRWPAKAALADAYYLTHEVEYLSVPSNESGQRPIRMTLIRAAERDGAMVSFAIDQESRRREGAA